MEQFNENRLEKKLTHAISRTAKKLRKTIATAVVSKYNIKRAEVEQHVRGKRASPQREGKLLVKQHLVYWYEKKGLHTFPTREVKRQGVKSRFIVPGLNEGEIFLIQKKFAMETQVAVRKRRTYKKVLSTTKGSVGKGFYVKGRNNSLWGTPKPVQTGIYARRQRRTWIVEPEVRAPIKKLYGKSVSQMVETIVNKTHLISREQALFSQRVWRLLHV